MPIADRPELAAPDPDLVPLLRHLAARPRTTVHIVSGRPSVTLTEWFGDLDVSLWAEHGVFHRPAGASWQPETSVSAPWRESVLRVLERFTADTPGSFIEQKAASLGWHYRLADADRGPRQADALLHTLATLATDEAFDVLRGKKVVEIRMPGVSKAVAARHVCSTGSGHLTILAIGDDQTDDDLFKALPAESLTVAVGRRRSAARYQLASVTHVRHLLHQLL